VKQPIELEEYVRIFRPLQAGDDYLRGSWPRFKETRTRILESFPNGHRGQLLDIGAHWLHQSLLYTLEGFTVTAADLHSTGVGANAGINALAAEHGAEIVTYEDLSNPLELLELGNDRFDVVLFSEIIEHITFNPGEMGRVVHQLLKPGGLIVVTTPNYFWPGYFLPELRRTLSGHSTGLPIREIVETNTYGPHWKVYSAADLRQYFTLLSPDFVIKRQDYFDTGTLWTQSARLDRLRLRFPSLWNNLYLEVRLEKKRFGITMIPRW
jgi:2-polyprenyl-6-hydroxyphenyl methylase/3-demethylubiquinone-9 3-methyltransferase